MCSIDTVGAYLYQEYPSTLKMLYMKLPRDVAEVCNLDPRTTYRVKKYLYGLPDAGGAYYVAYRNHLIAEGYTMTASDPCLFVRLIPKKSIITWVWVHVDDTCVASTSLEELERLKESLKKKFEINANELTKHLGVNIEALEDGSMLLRQRKLLGALMSSEITNQLLI